MFLVCLIILLTKSMQPLRKRMIIFVINFLISRRMKSRRLKLSSPDTNGRILEVRPKGHWFEFEVAKILGYNYPPGGGLFPDIRHQALEIKHHTGKSITVDFGRYHPGSGDVINETWNRQLQLKVNQIRYLIALAPPPKFKVTTLIVLTGAQIINVFGVSPTATIKYQMGISAKWREDHRGKMMVGEKIWLTE